MLFNIHKSCTCIFLTSNAPTLGEQYGPFLSFCSALCTNRVIWFIQNYCVTLNVSNPKTIMRICSLQCWKLMHCLILLWEMRYVKTTWQLCCTYKHNNYSACALMIYTKWTSCNEQILIVNWDYRSVIKEYAVL